MTELPWKPIIYLPANLTIKFSTMSSGRRRPGPVVPSKASNCSARPANRRQVDSLTHCLEEYADNSGATAAH